MRHSRSTRMGFGFGLVLGLLAVMALVLPAAAPAAEGPIKVGVLYDLTGPFAAAGAVPGHKGTLIALAMVNEKGGVLGKHKIQAVEGDSQSKPDVAINEAERLLNVEKVDVLLGIYSSAIAVPLAEKVDKQKRILWITIAIADGVFKGRNLQYAFRAQVNGGQFGEISVRFLVDHAQSNLKTIPLFILVFIQQGPSGCPVPDVLLGPWE